MDEQMQQQFIQWLAKKTGAKTQEDLQRVLAKLQSTKGQMEQVVQQFQQEMSGGQGSPDDGTTMEQPAFKAGGTLSYINCLKQGGTMDCGCIKKGAKGTKVTSQANVSAIKSPKYPALKPDVSSFTKKEIDNIPGWETTTTPMRIMEKGGILFADRGARLAARSEKAAANGNTNKADRLAKKSLSYRDKQLVRDFNYQGSQVKPGVFQRARNQFDMGAETLLKAQQPLQGSATSIALPVNIQGRTPVMNGSSIQDIDAAINARRSLTPVEAIQVAQDNKVIPAATPLNQPNIRPMLTPPTGNKATSLMAKAPVAQAQTPTKVNPNNIKGQKSVPANAVKSAPVRLPNQQYPGSTTILPDVIGEVEVIGKTPKKPINNVITQPVRTQQSQATPQPAPQIIPLRPSAPSNGITPQGQQRNAAIRASMDARGKDVMNDGTVEHTIEAAGRNQWTFSPIGNAISRIYNSF